MIATPRSRFNNKLLQITIYTLVPAHLAKLIMEGTEEHAAISAARAAWKSTEGVQHVAGGTSVEDERVLVVVLGI